MAESEFVIQQSTTYITAEGDGFSVTTTQGETEFITIGVQGPPGSATIETYVHDQSSASTLWVINHGLNRFPSVMVVDSTKREVITGIQYISANTIHIISDYAFAGQAFLN